MSSEFDFIHETCGTCAYYLETPVTVRKNICRFWVPTATSYEGPALVLHVEAERDACGQYKRHPNMP